jgi:hypothetical protein
MLSKDGSSLLLETALVAGKKTANSARHDTRAIYQMAAQNGVEFVADDSADMLQYVMLIPKSNSPNGVCDVVAEYDRAVGGVFYGEDRPQQDYVEYARICNERNQSFSGMVQQITEQLLMEATAFETPLEAIHRLDELSERVCVEYAVSNKEVRALVFGAESAQYIERARVMEEMGDIAGRDQAVRDAKNTANSSSCPLFKDESRDKGGDSDGSGDKEEGKGNKWMNCPHCSARVYDDPCAKVLCCWDCKTKVIFGVTFKGNGGSKKRREEEKTARLEAHRADATPEEEPTAPYSGKVALAGV